MFFSVSKDPESKKKQIESHKFRRGSIASPVVIPEGVKLQIKNQINEF